MCGICVILECTSETLEDELKQKGIELLKDVDFRRLCHRGPDIQNFKNIPLNQTGSAIFYGSTLHFRGNPTPQPLVDAAGNILIWNGEIFSGLKVKDQNDGLSLLQCLQDSSSEQQILNVFSSIHGPWAMVYYRKSWVEVPAAGIYCMDCGDQSGSSMMSSTLLYPWIPQTTENRALYGDSKTIPNDHATSCASLLIEGDSSFPVVHGKYGMVSNLAPFNRELPTDSLPSASNAESAQASSLAVQYTDILKAASKEQLQLADCLIEVLGEAVRVRVQEQAAMCDLCLRQTINKAANTMYYSDFSKAAVSASSDPGEQKGVQSDDSGYRESEVGSSNSTDTNSTDTNSTDTNSTDTKCSHARVAVLFSGGIDSLVLTALADRFLPVDEPVDLLNVAFEQKRVPSKEKEIQREGGLNSLQDPYRVPDRITGRDSAQLLNPARKWNFVEINVTVEELQQAREEHVQDLVYPLQTVLDDSIGCALWFAARGCGKLVHTVATDGAGTHMPYCSTARVVLVGMGADEQLAGYSRHRVKYNTGGLQALVEEIDMEIKRISSRNLGRDDRIITDHGKEARFPFLDENVVSFLNQLPIWNKADLTLPRGVGEKLLLRVAAARCLGLGAAAALPKRAIQFGSRIAKLENRKEKASDICTRLQDI